MQFTIALFKSTSIECARIVILFKLSKMFFGLVETVLRVTLVASQGWVCCTSRTWEHFSSAFYRFSRPTCTVESQSNHFIGPVCRVVEGTTGANGWGDVHLISRACYILCRSYVEWVGAEHFWLGLAQIPHVKCWEVLRHALLRDRGLVNQVPDTDRLA
eukprot:3848841-Amphidinium_carterae.2